MKKLSLILALLLTVSLRADPQWQTTTPIFENTLFRFQMPGIPEEQTFEKFSAWKVQTAGNTYWTLVKLRRCSTTTDQIKICDLIPLFNHVIPKKPKFLSVKKDEKNQPHFVATDGENSFFHGAVCFNQKIAVVFITQTTAAESPEHQRFIESFAFLE